MNPMKWLTREKALWLAGIFIFLGLATDWFGFSGVTWEEEVRLHDGSILVVERFVKRGGGHEIGQKPGYINQTLRFVLPGTTNIITWEDHFDSALGRSNFLPFALDIYRGTPYLVAYPMGCLGYKKWGRPNPPYVVFRYERDVWWRIRLADLPAEIINSNLVFSQPDVEAERLGKRKISEDDFKKIKSGYKEPEFRSIIREEVKDVWKSCG